MRSPLPDALVIAAAALFLIPLADLSPIFQVSEGREGVVVQEILRTGEYILPLRHGDTVPSKPILFHWISTVLARALGEYRELGLRLPSALAAIGCVYATFWVARALAGLAAGAFTAGALLSTYSFVHLARDGRVDMLFCSCVALSVAVWLRSAAPAGVPLGAPAGIPLRSYTYAGIAAGLAVLAKGPLGLVLPLTIVAAIACVQWGRAGIRAVIRPGWIWAIIVALPWYVLATISGRDSFLSRQILFENIQRLVGGPGIPAKPPTFYLEHMWGEAAPWSVLLLVVLLWAAVGKRKLFSDEANRFAFRAGLTWFLTVLFFFSVASGKRRAYLLPGTPGIAIAVGVLAAEWHRRRMMRRESERALAGGAFWLGIVCWLLLAAGTALLLALLSGAVTSPVQSPEALLYISSMRSALQRKPALLAAYFGLLLSASLLLWLSGRRRNSLLLQELGAGCFLQLVFCVVINFFVATKGISHSYLQLSRAVQATVPADESLYFIKRRRDESFDGLFFYLNRPVSIISPRRMPKAPGWYLARESWRRSAENRLQTTITPILAGGRPKDRKEQQLVLFKIE